MHKILIVEDDQDIRDELEIMLKNMCYETDIIEEFAHLPQRILQVAPDLILLDIELPGMDGLTLCREIRKQSQGPIIFVTGRSSPMDELSGLMLGGDDYISKPYYAPVLLSRIGAVLKRAGQISGGKKEAYEFCWKECTLNLRKGTISHEGKKQELTRNELRICYNLFSRCGQIVARADIIEDLWENQIFIDDNTLSVNITRIRAKLKEIGMENLIETRRGLGYRI